MEYKILKKQIEIPKIKRICMRIVAIVAAIFDIFFLVLLAFDRLPPLFWVGPAVLLLVDGIFLLESFFANYRVRYARLTFRLAATLGIVAFTFIAAMMYVGRTTMVTYWAMGVFLLERLVVGFFSFHCYKSASKEGKGNILSTFPAIAMTAAAAASGLFFFTNGVLGQGRPMGENKTLSYEYNEELGGYVVNGYVNGRGTIIDVPATFNGDPVVGINSDVLIDEDISSIVIEKRQGEFKVVEGARRVWIDAIVYQENPIEFSKEGNYPTVYCDKSAFDAFKDPILDHYYDKKDTKWLYIANNLIPSGLKDDEVYVTFQYEEKVMDVINHEYVDTWIGKKGSNYTPETENTPFYITARDHSNGDDLQKCYAKYKGILNPFLDKTGTNIFEKTVTLSSAVTVDFEPIYKFNILDGNDTMFQYAENYVSNTGLDDYYYSTFANVDKMFEALPEREGFSVEYGYSLNYSANETAIPGKLSDAIKNIDENNTINIIPTFTMDTPDFQLGVGTGETAFTCQYGDDIHLIAKNATSTVPNHSFAYQWKKNGYLANTGDTYSIQNMQPEDGTTYSCTLTVSSPNSSLTASKIIKQDVTYTKRKLDISWSGAATSTYDGTDYRPTPSVSNTSNLVNGDVVTPELTSTSPAEAINAGTYTFNAQIPSSMSSFYEIANGGSTTRTINKRSIQIVWNTFSGIYNGQEQLPTVSSITNKVATESDSDILNAPTADRTSKNAGSYTATVTVKSSNYTITSNATYDYSIAKKEITGTWGDVDLVYNGSLQSAQYASFSGVVTGEESSVLASVIYTGTQKDVGNTYSVTASLPSSSNYTISSSSDHVSFSIAALELSDYQWTADSLVYNGKTDNYPALSDATNLLAADKTSFIASLTPTADNDKNVGSHTITYTLPATCNYIFQGGATTISHPYTITQRSVALTWDAGTFEYDGTAHNPVVSAISNVQTGDTASAIIATITYSGDVAEIDADETGTLAVTAALPSSSNYVVSSNATKTYTITRKAITLNWSATTFTYDGNSHCPTISSVTGAVAGDETALVSDIVVTGGKTNAGSYTATAAIDSMTNYKITTATKSFIINQRTVTIDWSSASLTYNRNTQMPTYTVNNVVSGETSSFSSSLSFSGTGKNAGTYTVTASTSDTNYTIGTGKTKQYTILPYEIALTWATSSVTYNGSTQAPSYTIDGVLSGDTVTVTLTGTGKNVGSYSITATSNNSNYTIGSGSSKDYTILAREVAIDWGTASLQYSGADQMPTYTVDNVVSSEATSFKSSLTFTGKGKNVGSYTVSVTTSNTNYTISSGSSKTYEIVAREVSLSWSSAALTYNGNEQMPTYSLVNGISSEEAAFKAALVFTGRGTDAGTYTVLVTNNNTNYTITSGTSKLYEINPRQVSIVWSNSALTYNGSEQMPSFTLSNVVSGEETTFRAGLNFSGKGTDAGSHTVTVTNTNGNYEIASGASKTYSIGKYGVTITWNAETFTYDGNEHALTYIVGAVVSGEEAAFAATLTVTGAATNAGNHSMAISTSAANYTISSGSSKAYTIAQAHISLTWSSDVSFVADGAEHNPTVTGVTGAVSGEESGLLASITYTGASSEVGTHTVTATLTGNYATNYVIDSGATCNYEITAPAAVDSLPAIFTKNYVYVREAR